MHFELTKEYLDNLRIIIKNNDDEAAYNILDSLHAADIAEIFDELSINEAQFLYMLMENEKAADVLIELEEEDRLRFLKSLPSEVIANHFLQNLDSDDAADVLGELPEDKKEDVLSKMSDLDQAGDLVDLLHYDEDTAGGLMAKELISINTNWTIKTCLIEMKKQASNVDEVYYVYAIDDDGVLQGTVSLKRMLLSENNAIIRDILNEDVIAVKVDVSSEEVSHVMEKYDLVALPVVDQIGRLVGRITIDDVVDVIREEADKDYQLASGISQDVESSDSAWQLTKARFPWLLIGLIGGIFSAQIMGTHETELENFPIMAFFIPLIAAMGGNVGVQSSAIIVQGLANNSIGVESTGRKLFKEFCVALMNGFTLASIIFIFNFLTSDSYALTFSVSLSLFAVIVFASIFGTLIPLLLNKVKIDPALATGPFITTLNDIMGLLIYLIIGRYFFLHFV